MPVCFTVLCVFHFFRSVITITTQSFVSSPCFCAFDLHDVFLAAQRRVLLTLFLAITCCNGGRNFFATTHAVRNIHRAVASATAQRKNFHCCMWQKQVFFSCVFWFLFLSVLWTTTTTNQPIYINRLMHCVLALANLSTAFPQRGHSYTVNTFVI